jgi:pimeloyl-ACP methyl ester carboxylesterase
MQPVSRRVPGSGGLSLHLLEWSREGVPLLLLHGFSHEAHVWDDFAPLVAPHYRVLALDHRGHGDSDRDPERRYDWDTLVADVEAVTAHLGIERLAIVGHSLGGRTAMRYAARHPERMAGLVIVDIGPDLDWRGVLKIRDEAARTPVDFGSEREFENLLSAALPMARPAALARLAHHGLRRRADGRFEPRLDPFFREGVKSGPSDPKQMLADAERDAAELWGALARIPCPTLVVRGAASDVLSPETADRMVDEALPQGQLAVVARAAHAVMLENPEGFNQAVTAFVLGDD